MVKIEKLKADAQKFLRLRRALRVFEAIASIIVIVVSIIYDWKIFNAIACVVCILVISELIICSVKNGIKNRIRDESMIANKELEFYSEIKEEAEELRDDFISQGSENFICEECREIVRNEQMGRGWLSTKIKEFECKCNEAKIIIEDLASIERLVIS